MKRYTVQLSAYIWAESDEQAIEMADNYAKYLDGIPEMSDNRATADRLFETPFATIGMGREIKITI